MGEKKSKAILTAALGYGRAELAPLVGSLSETSFSGDLVVFASGLQDSAMELLKEFGAKVVLFDYPSPKQIRPTARYWRIWRRLFALRLPEGMKDFLAKRVMHHTYLRFVYYRQFLRDHGEDYETVFLTDCRDVVFQSDPLSSALAPGLHVYEEDRSVRIGDCPYHRKWFNDCFGGEVLSELDRNVRICSGTVHGEVPTVLRYLDLMREAIFSINHMNTCGDQAIHNYLLHRGMVPGVVRHPLGEGEVVTLGHAKFEDLQLDADGRVCDAAGRPFPVLHQYDRVPKLLERYSAKYGA